MRDDLKNLPLPPEAKSYVRRHGLAAMKKQPQSFINMNAAVSNQRSKKHGFKNTDEAGTVPKAIKECAAEIVSFLLENDLNADVHTFRVWKFGDPEVYAFETPTHYQYGIYDKTINYHSVPPGTDVVTDVERHMRFLVQSREYPPGSFFETPWGDYLVHGGTIGKI